jgi:hypothetical protein
MNLFPFEVFGPERHYPRVGAPAIGLRGKVKESLDRMREICDSLSFDTPLYNYFYRMTGYKPQEEIPYLEEKNLQIFIQPNKINASTVEYFVNLDPSILLDLDRYQIEKLMNIYPGLTIPEAAYSGKTSFDG